MEDKDSEGKGEAAEPSLRLLPTVEQEFQFAYDHQLLATAWTRQNVLVLQLVTPNEQTAVALRDQLLQQHPEAEDVVARRSQGQENRWVVQIPLASAENAGLLPGGVTSRNLGSKLSHGYAGGNAARAYESRHVAAAGPRGCLTWLWPGARR